MEIGRGAEAVITLEESAVRKWRIPKGYRLPELDEQIRRERTIREARITSEARRCGVPTPIIKDVLKFDLIMEHIGGQKLKDVITPALSEQVGEIVDNPRGSDYLQHDTSGWTNLPDRLRPGIPRRIGRSSGRGRSCLLPDAGIYSRQTG
jgi:Kae1-associated kinase Bud32